MVNFQSNDITIFGRCFLNYYFYYIQLLLLYIIFNIKTFLYSVEFLFSRMKTIEITALKAVVCAALPGTRQELS